VGELVLVTGGAGFIGSHLVDALLKEGHRVCVLDSLEPQVHGDAESPTLLSAEAEFVKGSVLDAELVSGALEGVDVVFHLAAQVGVGQSMYRMAHYSRENVVGSSVLLEEVVKRRDRIRKVIVASSMSIYGEGAYVSADGEQVLVRTRAREALERGEWEPRHAVTGEQLRAVPTSEAKPLAPTSVYAVTKRDQEEQCLSVGYAYRIPTVALRYFNVYGERQALSNPYTGVAAIFSSRLINGRAPVIFEDGEQSRDLVHVSDIVQANLLAMKKSGADYEALNVGTGNAVSILQVAGEIAEHLGRPDLRPEVKRRFREGDIRHCYADIGAIRERLGYEPRVQFGDGVAGLVEWVRSQEARDSFEQAHAELSERGLA
jgi:dTDP-L-rhamnose 4-epimerase